RSATPRCMSRTCAGRTSGRPTCTRRSARSAGASVGSEPSSREPESFAMSRSGRRELRTRLVLAPLLLGAIAAIYVVDLEFTGRHRGVLTAVVLGLVGFAGILEYVAMLQKARFAVATRLLPLACIALFAAPFGFGWQDIDRELYPVVLITFLLAFPIALDSL